MHEEQTMLDPYSDSYELCLYAQIIPNSPDYLIARVSMWVLNASLPICMHYVDNTMRNDTHILMQSLDLNEI